MPTVWASGGPWVSRGGIQAQPSLCFIQQWSANCGFPSALTEPQDSTIGTDVLMREGAIPARSNTGHKKYQCKEWEDEMLVTLTAQIELIIPFTVTKK